jgi:hypothetical protein
MMRLLAAGLLLAAACGAQFVEIQVDAGASHGEIPPVFGIDAPADARQATILLERGVAAPVRLGPAAALRNELAERLSEPWADESTRAVFDTRSKELDRILVWRLSKHVAPVAEAAAVIAGAIGLGATKIEAAYYSREKWFDETGRPAAALRALELGARMSSTPRRAQLEVEPDQGVTGLAGSSEDGETVQILLTRSRSEKDQPPPSPAFVLYVRDLPWGPVDFVTERYRLDAERHGELVSEGAGRGGLARISAPLAAPALELVVLRKQDAPPGAAVIRRRSRRTPE